MVRSAPIHCTPVARPTRVVSCAEPWLTGRRRAANVRSMAGRGTGGAGRLRDQTRAPLAGEIGPEPLALDTQTVLQLRQREDVNEGPQQPRQEAARAQPAPLQHGVVLADDGHVAHVEIAERTLGPPSLQLLRDQ